jgi:probable rRNA maturation factor
MKNRSVLLTMLRRAAILSGLSEQAGEDDELQVVLVDAAEITALNEAHLGHEGSTDVITFDLRDGATGPGEPQAVGEIYVCLDVAVQMGEELGSGSGHEMVLYCVHGMLHLAGLDDHSPPDCAEMRAAEARIMAKLRDIRDFRDIL